MLSAIILLQNLKWLFPTTLMLGAAPAYITIWTMWRVLSAPFPRWVYVKGDDFLFATYHRNLLFYFEIVSGNEIVFYGDLDAVEHLKSGENCIYMSNHQCTADWVLGSSISYRRGALGRTRYVLKDGLKLLPFYGFYLGMHGSLFVKRAGKFRKNKAQLQLERDGKDNKPMWLVVFPEGTRFNPDLPGTVQASKEFAVSQGFEALEHVLFPRTKALQICLEQLKGSVDSVYDVTIAYGNTFNFKSRERRRSPTMQDFLLGVSKRIHLHVRRIPIQEVPDDEAELKKWLYKQYKEKDRLLAEFYSANSEEEMRFPGERHFKPLAVTNLLPSVLLWSGSFVAFNAFSESRGLYWKVGLGLSAVGLVWMSVRY